jgi:hypothetical protein
MVGVGLGDGVAAILAAAVAGVGDAGVAVDLLVP